MGCRSDGTRAERLSHGLVLIYAAVGENEDGGGGGGGRGRTNCEEVIGCKLLVRILGCTQRQCKLGIQRKGEWARSGNETDSEMADMCTM
jgi:hypothetical protein